MSGVLKLVAVDVVILALWMLVDGPHESVVRETVGYAGETPPRPRPRPKPYTVTEYATSVTLHNGLIFFTLFNSLCLTSQFWWEVTHIDTDKNYALHTVTGASLLCYRYSCGSAALLSSVFRSRCRAVPCRVALTLPLPLPLPLHFPRSRFGWCSLSEVLSPVCVSGAHYFSTILWLYKAGLNAFGVVMAAKTWNCADGVGEVRRVEASLPFFCRGNQGGGGASYGRYWSRHIISEDMPRAAVTVWGLVPGKNPRCLFCWIRVGFLSSLTCWLVCSARPCAPLLRNGDTEYQI